ncbi:MAG: aminoacetone oxidase family FAD-binding enzyme [Bacilli bacterium]
MVEFQELTKVAIIGGGASGLFLAHDLSHRRPDILITIFEASDKLGRKIDISGNGRGNLSNIQVNPNNYNHPDLVEPILKSFPVMEFLFYCKKWGLMTMIDEEGRIYPRAEKGKIWRTILEENIRSLGVKIKLNHPVSEIKKTSDSRFQIGSDLYDYVVVATGSSAGPNYRGKVFDNTPLFRSLKVPTTSLYPTLSALGVKEKIAQLNGVRTKAEVQLWLDEKLTYQTKGEIQFRKDSLSGIAIFECSSLLTWKYRKNPNLQAKITMDLLPEVSLAELNQEIQQRFLRVLEDESLEDALRGMFVPELNKYLINCLDKKHMTRLPLLIKKLPFNIDLSYLPDNNQVISGGVDLKAVNRYTLESLNDEHLYFIGEALDIDGMCGGYNLHFAWASAYLVAKELQARIPVCNIEKKAFVRYTS